MKPRVIYYVAAFLAIALGFAVCDGLRTKDKYSVVVGQLEEAVKVKDGVIAEKDKVIEQANGIIAVKSAMIADILAQANKPTPAEVAKDKTIADLNATLANAKTDAEKVPILEGLVVQWQDKFTLSEQRRQDELTALNASWRGKYDAQVQISEAWKAKYEATARVLSLSENALKLSNRKLKRNQILSNISKVAIVGLGGYVLYEKLKKGSK